MTEKEDIIKFIKKTFKKKHFTQLSKEDFIFDTYDQMIEYNTNHINTLSNDDIKLVSKLIQLISAKKLKMVDKDNCDEIDTISLYYNKDNKLVFLHD